MPEPYVGEIRMFAGNFAPAGWHFCDGATMAIAENDVLFQLIGTTYGGDGQTTFDLPNLQSRVPIHMGTGPSGTTYTIGEMAGTEQETLTTQQIPVHSHPLTGSTDFGNTAQASGLVIGQSSTFDLYVDSAATSNMNAQAIGPAGGSQPHENTQPFLCINFIISLYGVYPTPT